MEVTLAMFLTWHGSWSDPNSAWCAKANRALEHLDALRLLIDEFRATEPFTLTPEPTDNPKRVAYRLRYKHPVPTGIRTTIGDVLHNLRGALESLAFEAARLSQSGVLSAEQESLSAFPICKSPAEFEKFINSKRGQLFDSRAAKALRSVQPFVNLEQLHQHGVSLEEPFEQRARWEILYRLNRLWNIDKHRRLVLTAWWPDLLYWGSHGPTNRQAFPGHGTLADGSILLYIEGSDEGMGNEINHEFNLVLMDDPAVSPGIPGTPDDVVDLLEGWHEHITRLVVFPRIFTIMSQSSEAND
jgi:hypothetical protein